MKFLLMCSCLLLGLLAGCGGGGGENSTTGGSGGSDLTYTRFPIAFPYSTTTAHTLSPASLPVVSQSLVQLNDALAVLAFTGDVTTLQTFSLPLQPVAANAQCTTGALVTQDSPSVASSEFKACAMAGVVVDGKVLIKKSTVPEITYQVTINHPATQQQFTLTGFMMLREQTLLATGTMRSPNMPTLHFENVSLGLNFVAERYLPWLQSGQITVADQGTFTIRIEYPSTTSVAEFLSQVAITPLNAVNVGEKGLLQQWFRDGSIRVVNSSALVYAYPASLIYQKPNTNQPPVPQLNIVSEVLAANEPFQISHFNSTDANGDALTFDLQVESLVPGGSVTVTPNATGYRLVASMAGEYIATLTVTDPKGAKASVSKPMTVRYSPQTYNHMLAPTLQLTNLKPFEYSLRVAKGKQAELVHGPAGMTVQNNVLRWTPQLPAVGGTALVEATIKVVGMETYENTKLHIDTAIASQQSFVMKGNEGSGTLQPLLGGQPHEFLYTFANQPAAVLTLQNRQIQVQGLPVTVPGVVRQSRWLRKTATGFELLALDGSSRWVNLQSGIETPLAVTISDMLSMTFDYDHDGNVDALVRTRDQNLKVLSHAGAIVWDSEQGNVATTVKTVVGHCDADQDGFEDVVIQNATGVNELVSLKKRQILGLTDNEVHVIKSPSTRCYLLKVKNRQLQGVYSFANNQLAYTAYSGAATTIDLPLQQGRFISGYDTGVMANTDGGASIVAIKDGQLSVILARRFPSKVLGIADLDLDGKDELVAFDDSNLQGFRFANGLWTSVYQPAFQPQSVPTYQTADTQLWMSESAVRYQQQWYAPKDSKLPADIRALHNLVHRDLTKLPDGVFRFDDANGNLLWQTKPTFSQPEMTGYAPIKTSEIAVVLAGNGEAAVLNMRTGEQKYRVAGGPNYWNSVKLFRLQSGLHLLWSYEHQQVLLLTDTGYSWLSVPDLVGQFRWQPILAKIDQGYLAGTRLLLGNERPVDAFESSFPIDVLSMCDPLRFNCNGKIVDGVEQGTQNQLWDQLPDVWPQGSVVGVRQLDGSYVAFVIGSPVMHILEPAKP